MTKKSCNFYEQTSNESKLATNSLNSGNPKSKSNQLIQSNIFEKTLN